MSHISDYTMRHISGYMMMVALGPAVFYTMSHISGYMMMVALGPALFYQKHVLNFIVTKACSVLLQVGLASLLSAERRHRKRWWLVLSPEA